MLGAVVDDQIGPGQFTAAAAAAGRVWLCMAKYCTCQAVFAAGIGLMMACV